MSGLRVLYEDAALAVVEKPAGVLSEAGDGTLPSVPGLLRAAWGDPGAFAAPVSRLDVPVSGLLLCAKTPQAAAALSGLSGASGTALSGRPGTSPAAGTGAGEGTGAGGAEKLYRCICAGVPQPPDGEMADILFKDGRTGRVYPVKRERRGAKPARLSYRVEATAALSAFSASSGGGDETGQAALCAVRLYTGRTHQIRAQFAARKHPLLGDGKYGSRAKGPLALQCAALRFSHPETGAPLAFALPLPQDGFWTLFAGPAELAEMPEGLW